MLHLIINPSAGNGRGARIGAEVVEALTRKGIAHTAAMTQRPGHGSDLAREAVAAGAETILAIGGDGTVREVAAGLHGGGATLGIIPAGTGNDVAKMLHLPKKPLEALDYLLAHPARPLDAGRAGEGLFVNVCGTGFDVCVLDFALKAKKYVRGMLPYLLGVLRTMLTYRPLQVQVQVDDAPAQNRSLLLAAVANGRYFGGGMDVAPDSSPNDGLFDLILIDAMPRHKMPFQLPKLLNGHIMDVPGATCLRCKRVHLRAKGMRVNVDGEILPMEEALFEMLPAALMVHW
ncbi:MAG: diacylglycerol kinase family lipid kinase [Oscillospiraceae bacterium]|jgi:YegS/Rv2252/BmrU family lipid kinase|nr:diacylglycerol kinase family lipid kinase [Oscillospiraceae bacterium]